METHRLQNEIFKWKIYVGNKIDMGTPKFVNPKPQVVDIFLETKKNGNSQTFK